MCRHCEYMFAAEAEPVCRAGYVLLPVAPWRKKMTGHEFVGSAEVAQDEGTSSRTSHDARVGNAAQTSVSDCGDPAKFEPIAATARGSLEHRYSEAIRVMGKERRHAAIEAMVWMEGAAVGGVLITNDE